MFSGTKLGVFSELLVRLVSHSFAFHRISPPSSTVSESLRYQAVDLLHRSGHPLAHQLAADPRFSYGTDRTENNFFYCLSDNPHQDLCSRYYLYNAFRDVLFR